MVILVAIRISPSCEVYQPETGARYPSSADDGFLCSDLNANFVQRYGKIARIYVLISFSRGR